MIYLKASAIRKLHTFIVETVGGDSTILHDGLVVAAADRPRTSFVSISQNDYEPYEDIISKATCLGYALITWHAFFDGNKRTGVFSMATTLALNGITLHFPPYLTKYAIKAAAGEYDESKFREAVRPLCSTSSIGNAYKTFRYDFLPYFVLRFLRLTRFFHEWYLRKAIDWYGGGHPEIWQMIMEEQAKVKFRNAELKWTNDDFLVEP
ncbi:MAG: type II toxin-antitoxin system death-on-curing family toxin [Thaumarchaeota archaeon]|nr:type II toxin-antitoxin system death-on-curing family toxin [Nitrososphaerota archaeon]